MTSSPPGEAGKQKCSLAAYQRPGQAKEQPMLIMGLRPGQHGLGAPRLPTGPMACLSASQPAAESAAIRAGPGSLAAQSCQKRWSQGPRRSLHVINGSPLYMAVGSMPCPLVRPPGLLAGHVLGGDISGTASSLSVLTRAFLLSLVPALPGLHESFFHTWPSG